MGEKVTKLRYSGIFVKTERDDFFKPRKPSAEARICLGCDNKNCKGNCKRYKEEHKKLKERKNGRKIKNT